MEHNIFKSYNSTWTYSEPMFQFSTPSKLQKYSHVVFWGFNSSRSDRGQREKINLNFYLHTSLRCLKRFYEGLIVTFYSGTTFWNAQGGRGKELEHWLKMGSVDGLVPKTTNASKQLLDHLIPPHHIPTIAIPLPSIYALLTEMPPISIYCDLPPQWFQLKMPTPLPPAR